MHNQKPSRNVIVIGASAGGVEALIRFFEELPADLSAAILVVLHIPSETPSQLGQILARSTKLPVRSGVDMEELLPGQVYVASADRHLMVEGDRIRITRGPRESRARPSIDVLFRSASVACGSRAVAVILSGALDDGTAGAWAIKDRGGLVLAQEPSDAMHASMPESVIKHVQVDHVGTAQQLGSLVSSFAALPGTAMAPYSDRGRHDVETLIALEGDGLKAGVMDLGRVSKYTCPDCHGVLVQIEEGPIVRFRCHTGHAYSLMTLLAEVNESIDKGLWHTLRSIEERVMLLRQIENLARHELRGDEADRWKRQADETEERIKPLRELVLDSKFFGHDQRA